MIVLLLVRLCTFALCLFFAYYASVDFRQGDTWAGVFEGIVALLLFLVAFERKTE